MKRLNFLDPPIVDGDPCPGLPRGLAKEDTFFSIGLDQVDIFDPADGKNESGEARAAAKIDQENTGLIPLELIEVQSGSYLGEDDIVRFDDVYGR